MSFRTKFGLILVSATLALYTVVGGWISTRAQQPANDPNAQLRIFESVLQHIQNDYVDEPNMDKVRAGALRPDVVAVEVVEAGAVILVAAALGGHHHAGAARKTRKQLGRLGQRLVGDRDEPIGEGGYGVVFMAAITLLLGALVGAGAAEGAIDGAPDPRAQRVAEGAVGRLGRYRMTGVHLARGGAHHVARDPIDLGHDVCFVDVGGRRSRKSFPKSNSETITESTVDPALMTPRRRGRPRGRAACATR